MSSLKPPSLGPIVGHTTATSCKLWIRAKDSEAFQVGVVKVLETNGKLSPKNKPTIHYFRLDKESNRIGVFNLGDEVDLKGQSTQLQPDTEYKVCLATLTIKRSTVQNKKLSNQALKQKLPNSTALSKDFDNLGKKFVALFRTFPKSQPVADRLTFLFGSCHYPGSDSIFVPMDQQVCDAQDSVRPRFVLMVGDQIYADKWTKYFKWIEYFKPAETYKEFRECYRTAFGSKNMRRLLRHTPTYMILDDHEIEDNWSSERRLESQEKKSLFCNAIKAYKNYQWSHGPRTFNDDEKFYYTFDVAGYPFFVLDTRTKRVKSDKGIERNDMLGQDQLDELLQWLKDMQRNHENHENVPKFIVSPSVFVPNEKEERTEGNSDSLLSQSDSWPAFPTTREAILDCIVENQVQNVVFLSGDIHCSTIAEISLTGSKQAKQIKAFSITSSPFYFPALVFDGDANDYVSDSKSSDEADDFPFGKDKRFTMNYRSFFPFAPRNSNFCRVEIKRDKATIVIRLFDYNGKPIKWSDPQSTSHHPDFQRFQMKKW